MARRRSKRRWIQRALGSKRKRARRRGALHRMLGIPIGRKIPYKILRRAAKRPGILGRRARFALNVRHNRRSR